jgi:acyl-CoA reductase-like NAD-dependent aldehyde dehydrogenase
MSIESRRVPIGVVGLITPWNYPLLQCAMKLFPAIVSGNTIVLKCSEETPLSILRLCHLIKESGFPKGVINVVPGYGPIAGERLTMCSNVRMISFTGSYTVGQRIMKASSESNLKKVDIEMGCKTPIIVFSDSDIDCAIKCVIEASFKNTAQCCFTPVRLYLQESIYDRFLLRLIESTKSLKTSSFSDSSDNFCGPLISNEQMMKVFDLIKKGKDEKFKVEIGGERMFDKGYFIQPTIFSNVTETSSLFMDCFGPVLLVMRPFKDCEEVIERVNKYSGYWTISSVFTKCNDTAELMMRSMCTGACWVNCFDMKKCYVPFGSRKMSGMVKESGEECLWNYSTLKVMYKKFDWKMMKK